MCRIDESQGHIGNDVVYQGGGAWYALGWYVGMSNIQLLSTRAKSILELIQVPTA